MKKRIVTCLLALIMIISMAVPAMAASVPFKDVPTNSWYRAAVEYCYSNGLMSGNSSTEFAPSQSVNRAMMVQVLYNMGDKNITTSDVNKLPFKDVSKTAWYAKAVAWGYKKGVTSGTSATAFSPNTSITREQVATMFYNYHKMSHSNMDTSSSKVAAFSDYSKISNYAKTPMAWAVNFGLLSGVGNNKLDPKGTATRAQLAQILMNYNKAQSGSDNKPSATPTPKPSTSPAPTATPKPTSTPSAAPDYHIHKWVGKTLVEPTCTTDGLEEYTCTVCGDTYTREIGPANHPYETVVIKDATCTENGKSRHTCPVCGDSYESLILKLSKDGKHNYTSKVTREATCTTEGVRTYTCTVCKDSYTEAIPKLSYDHQYVTKVTKEATCTEDGRCTYTCSLCGFVLTDIIPHTGHNYTSKITKAATCTADGVKTYTCSNCKNSYTESIAKLGHSYTSKVTKAATCSANGVRTYSCSKCGNSYTESIAKLSHTYTSKVTKEPTCTATGVRTYTCSACKGSYTESIAKTAHNWTSKTIHHDAVMGTRDVTETWTHGYGYIGFHLTQAGIDAGLENSIVISGTTIHQNGFHVKLVSEGWYKEGNPSDVEWIYRYGEGKPLSTPFGDVYNDNEFIAKCTLDWTHDTNPAYWISYVTSSKSFTESRVVGSESYVITPAYDETITTCAACGTHK